MSLIPPKRSLCQDMGQYLCPLHLLPPHPQPLKQYHLSSRDQMKWAFRSLGSQKENRPHKIQTRSLKENAEDPAHAIVSHISY